MTHNEIRSRFLIFFKKRKHAILASSSLLPDDPSVLFTTAGMQQFKPYYTGEADAMKDFGSLNATSIQKSLRTNDIDEVGDATHLTFFEMLGNFSFGGYWKKEAITWAHEFITKEMNLPISYVTVFQGSDVVPKDEESKEIWRSLGIAEENIREEGMDDVFWGPTGNSGPCGPTTEIYCKNANGQDVEIWNIVFNEFFCDGSREQLLKGEAKLTPLKTKGIDTGMGLERLAMISQEKENIFQTDLFESVLSSIIQIQGGKPIEKIRLIADHLRAATFLIADGVIPGKGERDYILRRLIRDAMTAHHSFIGAGLDKGFFVLPVDTIINLYKNAHPYLVKKHEYVISMIGEEINEYSKILLLISNISDLKKLYYSFNPDREWPEEPGEIDLDARALFGIRQTKGVSWTQMQMVSERSGYIFSKKTLKQYDEEFKKHQEISRAGTEKKFGGHGLLLDTGELKAADEAELKIVTRLHTATHLLQAALRKVLGEEVHQAGSDITAERTRFDFTFPRKMTKEEIEQVERLVNEVIQKDLPVNKATLPKEEAEKTGALHFFKVKYPEMVDVYTVGGIGGEGILDNPSTPSNTSGQASSGPPFSREFCGGPHVTHTGEIGEFKITKEEASSAGVRRIRAVVR